MTKFIDNTGVDTLVRALLSNTKQINGRTIWGSGNLEIGGSVIDIDLFEWNFEQFTDLIPGQVYRLKNYYKKLHPLTVIHKRATDCDIYVMATSSSTLSSSGVMVVTEEGSGDTNDNNFKYHEGDSLEVKLTYNPISNYPIEIIGMYDPIRDIYAPFDFVFLSTPYEPDKYSFPLSKSKHINIKSGGLDDDHRWTISIKSDGLIENVEIGSGCTDIYLCATDIKRLYISDNCSYIKGYFRDTLSIIDSSNIYIFYNNTNVLPNLSEMNGYLLSNAAMEPTHGLPCDLRFINSKSVTVHGIKEHRVDALYNYSDIQFKNCNSFDFDIQTNMASNYDQLGVVSNLSFDSCNNCYFGILVQRPKFATTSIMCDLSFLNFKNINTTGYAFLRSFERKGNTYLDVYQFFYDQSSENDDNLLDITKNVLKEQEAHLTNPTINSGATEDYFEGTYLGIMMPVVGEISASGGLNLQYTRNISFKTTYIPMFRYITKEEYNTSSLQWGPQA